MPDPTLRGSGELLHQVKARALSLQDVEGFISLLWRADSKAVAVIADCPAKSIDNLARLMFLVRIDNNRVMLNPHVAQIGGQQARGDLRARFRKLLQGAA